MKSAFGHIRQNDGCYESQEMGGGVLSLNKL